MYFFAVIENTITKEPHVPCGDSALVDVDGRHNLLGQFSVAYDHLIKRFPDKLLGIACYKKIGDKNMFSSIKTHQTGGCDFSKLTAFNHLPL